MTNLIGWIGRVYFLALTQALNVVLTFLVEERSGIWEGHYASLILACFIYYLNSFNVYLGSLSCRNIQ